ncbi:uncharacterized protein LOC114754829 [Neltuma alba]|uniref:uncharacterized protein LOC114754829 n=1 Tax=Neltuma alba TaxID=207710 RepID=UPI0010A56A1C|nr:uncharacterized protein LOC114754829 [Prosopis alba]
MNEKNRKGIPLKAQESEVNDEEDLEDEEKGLIIRRFKKFYKNRAGRRFQSKHKATISQNEPKEPIICNEFKKPGHIKADCPQLSRMKDKDKKKQEEKFRKKKAFMTSIWGESSSEEEDSDDKETANIYLMA